jgi:hypothetical protein
MNLPPPVDCDDDNPCYIKTTLEAMRAISAQIDYLDLITNYSIIFVGVCGILATVMIALQGDNNKVWTRPIGIVATALVTGITALVSSFHVPETKDGLIDIYGKIGTRVNSFIHDVRGRSIDETDDARSQYVTDWAVLKIELLKLKGSPRFATNPLTASSAGASPPAASQQPAKTTK